MKTLLFILLIITPLSAYSQAWKTYPYHEEGTILNFPEDEGYHPGEPIEWWYANGRVTGQNSGTDHSFMLTYFSYPIFGYDGFRILNLANEDTGEFYDETLPADYPLLSEGHLEIQASVGFVSHPESWVTKDDGQGNLVPFEYHISANGAYGALELDLKSLKPPLMIGGTGYLNQGLANYTYYYSQTALEITGTLTFLGYSEPVSGIAWIDRQYGDFNPNEDEPYEWFSLQLSNGMDINLWNVFTGDGQLPDTCTYRVFTAYVDDTTSVTSCDFDLERLAFDWMQDNQICYSKQWRFTAGEPELDLVMTVQNPGQEVDLPFRFYEGTIEIEGTVDGQPVTGHGFAELLHQYEHPALNILAPAQGDPWNAAQPIVWELLNPDDGRPVSYTLEVSMDDKSTWTPLAESISDTSFLWDANGWPTEAEYWFRVSGYSADSTLTGAAESDMAYSIISGDYSRPAEAGIRVFPNPASGQVFVETNDGDLLEVRLYDPTGQELMRTAGSSSVKLDVQGLPAGLYWLNAQGRTGTVVRKLAVARPF